MGTSNTERDVDIRRAPACNCVFSTEIASLQQLGENIRCLVCVRRWRRKRAAELELNAHFCLLHHFSTTGRSDGRFIIHERTAGCDDSAAHTPPAHFCPLTRSVRPRPDTHSPLTPAVSEVRSKALGGAVWPEPAGKCNLS